MQENYYDLLQVSQDADLATLKSAIKRRGDAIKLGFATLSNAERRKEYDTDLAQSIANTDHYLLLAISQDADFNMIKQAAQNQINMLKDALRIFSDAKARQTYDEELNTRQEEIDLSPDTELEALLAENTSNDDNDTVNPYAAPESDLEAGVKNEGYQPFKLFSFKGRVGRVRYINYSMVISFLGQILTFALGFLVATFETSIPSDMTEMINMGVMGIGALFTAVLSLMLTMQRLHDFNRSGWYFVVIIILTGLLGAGYFMYSEEFKAIIEIEMEMALAIIYLPIIIFTLMLWLMPGTKGENNYGLPTPPNRAIEIIAVVLLFLLIVAAIVLAMYLPAYLDMAGFSAGMQN